MSEQLTIGVTYDLKEDWQWRDGEPKDASAEFDKPETIDRVCKAFEGEGHKVVRIGNVDCLLKQINDLQVDLIFNMCEGKVGRNREMQVPVLLEMYDIPFVGSDALTLGVTLDKVAAKKIFKGDNLPTADYFVVRLNEANRMIIERHLQSKNLTFPLMVKTCYEGSSKGINEDARVIDMQSLEKQIQWIHENYNQPVLVEDFIKGTEFTVAVMGNEIIEAMPVVQYVMDGKYDLGDAFYSGQRLADLSVDYICPAQISTELEQKLQRIAIDAYRSVECRDFGRVDFRVDENENPFILEVNPLPSLECNDVFDVFPKVLGTTFDTTMNKIVQHAVKRYDMFKKFSYKALKPELNV